MYPPEARSVIQHDKSCILLSNSGIISKELSDLLQISSCRKEPIVKPVPLDRFTVENTFVNEYSCLFANQFSRQELIMQYYKQLYCTIKKIK